jgi:hypothetical protein
MAVRKVQTLTGANNFSVGGIYGYNGSERFPFPVPAAIQIDCL